MDGNIIDIRRFTVHDGYGIRSTVFLKGCNLHCAWCHNPEGIENSVGLWHLPRQCIRCGSCIRACPEGALTAYEGEEPYIVINRQRCTLCGRCVEACPTTAMSFDGRRISSLEVVETLLRDREFYRQSGGGITVSGGDPLVQHDFALDILTGCRKAGVHTAIETGLQGAWEVLASFLAVTDLFIVDLKLADPQLHREYTGHDNSLIRENYQHLAVLAPDMLTRIPMIPGITDRPDNVRAIARFVAECRSGARVELINFNPLAPNKYQLMNRDRDFFRGMAPLSAEALESLRAIIEAEGLEALRERRA